MNYKLLLTLGASLALMTPLSAQHQGNGNSNGNGKNKSSEKDKKQNKKGNNTAPASSASSTAKANSHHNNSTAQANSAQVSKANTARVSSIPASTAQVSRYAAEAQQPYYNNAANQQRASTTQQRYNNAQQSYQNPNQQNYNRDNQYGGNWSSADSHPNWNRNNEYEYNNQNYRWYDGGWLMITAAFTPQYYNNSYYATVDSTVSRVQVRLANQGYYHGAIDGDLGPGTSKAIAGYQNDNGLYVTGQINNALLQSLQVR